jgi:hypothetical protein
MALAADRNHYVDDRYSRIHQFLQSIVSYFINEMGMEYKLSFPLSDIREIQRLLTLISSFSRFEPNAEIYEFRNSDNLGEMPNVFVKIESDGLYLCNNGDGKTILEDLIQRIEDKFGSGELEEL